ncbi:type II/IV secretion system protein [Pseudomonas sp. CA3A]|uniref:Type II/IV secretion system protein n=2 Tax=Pseudomonas typographi TaxID=2715964 RepID=A0ABR7Z3N2_9PSED|nr:type II/IV secretion system protein [Pseudomonas typographi]
MPMLSEPIGGNRPLQLHALLQQLAQQTLISPADITPTLQAHKPGQHPLLTLAQRQFPGPKGQPLCLEQLTQWLAEQAGLPYRRIDPFRLDVASVTSQVSAAFAKYHQILPLEVAPEHVVVATAEPWVTGWVAGLATATRRRIERVVANPQVIEHLIGQLFHLAHSVNGAQQAAQAGLAALQRLPAPPEGEQAPVSDIINWLLNYAFEQGASDIHLEPRSEQAQVRLRIDGMLLCVYSLPTAVATAVTSRLKSLGQLNLAEKRKPQDGRFRHTTAQGKAIELRVSTLPTAFGEKTVVRLFNPELLLQNLPALGLAGAQLARWQGIIHQPNGIILVTGPTGSGKTTTLYATLHELARPEVNLCTIEDPIEVVNPALNQMQVRHNINLGFASGLRALMRQDPDIIMVGEIRDVETAHMAVQAALTGHLVLSTLHTNDAPAAVTRLQEMGVPHHLINATLLGVMAQRLLRTLCPYCKAAGAINEQDWHALIHPWRAPAPARVFSPVGCDECHGTGYKGRMAIYEIMLMTDRLKAQVGPATPLARLRARACQDGMRPLRIGATVELAAGNVCVQEVLRVTPAAQGNSVVC